MSWLCLTIQRARLISTSVGHVTSNRRYRHLSTNIINMVLIGQCLLLLINLMCMSYFLKTQMLIGIDGKHFVPEPLFLHSFIIPIPVFGVIMYKNVSFLFTSSKALVLYILFKVFCKIWNYAGTFTLLAPFCCFVCIYFFHNIFMLFAKYCNFGVCLFLRTVG